MNTNLMQLSRAMPQFRKRHVAFLLAALAVLSWAYSITTDYTVKRETDAAGIPLSLDSDGKSVRQSDQ